MPRSGSSDKDMSEASMQEVTEAEQGTAVRSMIGLGHVP
jgi:hypothetical protein